MRRGRRLYGDPCRRFIRDYGTIVAPLMKLLYKEGFRWTPEAEAAFRALQHALTSGHNHELHSFIIPA
jgi:hypothetical protein